MSTLPKPETKRPAVDLRGSLLRPAKVNFLEGAPMRGDCRILETGWLLVVTSFGNRVTYPPHSIESMEWDE